MAEETVKGAVDSGSGAGSTVSQTGAGAGGAQAGVGTEARGSQTGAGQAGVGAAQQTAQAETGMDIGQAEAYTVNLKSLVDEHLTHSTNLRAVALESLRRSNRNAEDYDQTLRNLAQQSLQSAVTLQNRIANGSTDLDTRIKQNAVDHDGRVRVVSEVDLSENARVGKIASDRSWNVNETDAISATLIAAMVKNPVFQDAIAGAVAAAVAAAIKKE